MTTIYDVPAENLIRRTADELKTMEKCQPPEWAPFVKTASHKEKAPTQEDWWHIRQAAILRKVYMHGPVGIEHLRGLFCGARDRGSKPNRTVPGSGSIIRVSLQQLEAMELVKAVKGRGRELTPGGRKLMDRMAHEVMKDIITQYPELGKY